MLSINRVLNAPPKNRKRWGERFILQAFAALITYVRSDRSLGHHIWEWVFTCVDECDEPQGEAAILTSLLVPDAHLVGIGSTVQELRQAVEQLIPQIGVWREANTKA